MDRESREKMERANKERMDRVSKASIYPHALPHSRTRTADLPVNVYPLSSFHYCRKPPNIEKASSAAERFLRRVGNYCRVGMRTTVQGILVVHHNGYPYVLVLKRGTFHKLPGGRLRPGENEIEGLKRKLTSKLGCILPQNVPDWKIGGCVATWWRPSFGPLLSLDKIPQEPKECIRLFTVQLSEGMHIAEPENFNFVFVSLLTARTKQDLYGRVISSLPEQLTGVKLNLINH